MGKFYRLKINSKKNCLACLGIVFSSLHLFSQPTISSFTPTSGPVGSTVTITGTNFSTTSSNNIVFFGAVRASVSAATTTSLTVSVPAGATYQPITVSVNNLTAYSPKPFIITFSGATPEFTSQSFEYAARVDSVDSNIETTKYAIGDIDNDGKIDVVTIDRLNNSMSVYRNTTTSGVISFAAKVDFATGQSPRSVSIGDIDGDGKLDVVVSNFNDNTVSIFKNTSSGSYISFSANVDFSTGTQPAAISIIDLDYDGKPDLVVNTVNLNGYVTLLRNTSGGGTLSFASKIDIQAAGGSIEEIRTADIDGDGKADIVLPNYSLNAITIFRNTSTVGNISFASPVNISSFQNPADVEIGDLDGDGKQDLVVSHYLNINVIVLRNISSVGNIVFQYTDAHYSGNSVNGLAINDLDGDGKPDIIADNLGFASLFKNRSSSGNILFDYSAVTVPALYTSQVITGDFDNDGKADLAFNAGTSRVSIWKNRTTSPQIFSFSPASGATGDTVTIQGANFSDITSVSFGGEPASSFTVVNGTTITAVVGIGTSGDIVMKSANDSARIPGFVFAGPPVIFSYTPMSATTGDTITITGQNFFGATTVNLGGTAANSFTIVSANTIKAVVGTGSSGSVVVGTSYGSDTLAGFTYVPVPKVISFSPTNAATGTTVVISGLNFTGTSAVTFGDVPVSSFIVVSSTTINAIVGNGASGNVSVTNPSGTGTLGGFTYIPPPVISSFFPTSASTGGTVTITGTNFNGVTSVKFGGVNASSFNIVSSTTIKAVVDLGFSGDVSVISDAGVSTLAGFIFISPPTINSFSPTSGSVGTVVTITGNNFSRVAANNIVYFGSIRAQVISASDDSLTVLVPICANYRRISVTVNNLTSFSKDPFIVTFNGGSSLFTATSFSSSQSFPAGFSDPFNVTSEDLDGDGRPDAIYADNYSSLVILRNTSTGGLLSFAPKLNLATAWVPYFVTAADFNGDGKKDIAVTNGNARSFSIFINTSTGGSISFAPRIDISTPEDCFQIIAEDIDNDGRVDIVIRRGSFTISMFRNISANNGPITFSNIFDLSVDYADAGSLPMEIFDLDGDNKPDLIFADYGSSTVAVYRNTSSGNTISFGPKVEFPGGQANTWLALGDIDGDGKPDIVTNSKYNTTYPATILRNLSTPGNISFATKIDFGGVAGAEDVNIADMNGDGKPDIVVVPLSAPVAPAPPRVVSIFRNSSTPGNISFDPSADYIITAGETSHVFSVLDDFNGDGKPDVGSTYNALFSVITSQVGGPGIASFSPTEGSTGSVITIKGNDFKGTANVSFGGVLASSFTIVDSATIAAIVGTGASGDVVVTTSHGAATLSGFKYQVATSVGNVIANSKELKVYPNPAKDYLLIEHPMSSKEASIRWIDISGQTMKITSVARNITKTDVNTKNLSAGIYTVIWSDGARSLEKTVMIWK